jgi:hypothetical protein
MTLQEKLEQIQLLPDFMVTDQEVKNGLGSVLSVTDPATINRLQHIAVDQSRLHIPLLFAFDTIHGFRTIFPIPLGTASSFDPQAAMDDATIGAAPGATATGRPQCGDRAAHCSATGNTPERQGSGKAEARAAHSSAALTATISSGKSSKAIRRKVERKDGLMRSKSRVDEGGDAVGSKMNEGGGP